MQKLYFVRHGECELNLEKVFAGQTDSPLTERGQQQALLAAQDIIDKGIAIDYVITSPLWRTQETARIIAEAIGYPVADVHVSSLFIERSFGMLEGTPRSEFFDAYSYADIDDAPRAEKIEALHARAQEALEYVTSIGSNNILIVSHSAFGRAFMRAITGEPHTKEYTSPFLSIKNGKVVELI